MRLRSEPRPPSAVRAALSLLPGERVLAWATGPEGQWYIGTDLALHLPAHQGRYRRIGWEAIERADWQSDQDRLAIVEVAEWGSPEPVTVLTIETRGQLLDLLRERVTKSIVYRRYAAVRRSAGLSVVGRRSPSGNGPIVWSYVLSSSLDPTDPDVLLVAEDALDTAIRELDGL